MEFIKAPADGKVLEAHEDLEDNLELVNEDPYGEGWIVKIEINDPAQTEDLMDAEGYRKYVAEIEAAKEAEE